MSEPVGRLGWIQIDCNDPERLASFWADVLVTERWRLQRAVAG